MSLYEKTMRACFNLALYKSDYRPYRKANAFIRTQQSQDPKPTTDNDFVHRLMKRCYNMALIKP